MVKMGSVGFWALAMLGMVGFVSGEVYIVIVEGDPVVTYRGGLERYPATAVDSPEDFDITSEHVRSYSFLLDKNHNAILASVFEPGTYKKLYSYHHLINGFAISMSPEQANVLRKTPAVLYVEEDSKVTRLTTHTPEFLGLPTAVWPTGGGTERAGENIVIGFIDSGIYPQHPSFAAFLSDPYEPVGTYRGKCEVDPDTKRRFCNGKIVGAQHFSAAAIAAGLFNSTVDFASPLDGDGHGSHTAAIAAGNNGIPVRMHGYEFGKASGMAPRARVAVYKAIYRGFGGFAADVVAAIEQAVKDGVDIINLSVGPKGPTATRTTFLNPFDAALLSAVKAGVFVVQAAGNGGPFPKSMVSFGPWITSVAAAIDDRRYQNHLTLGNGKLLPGVGLSPATQWNQTFSLIAANDAMVNPSESLYGPSDCQKAEVLDRKMVEGRILLCGYSINFVMGNSSIRKVSQTAKSLGAVGFVLAVESFSPEAKFDPIPVGIPGIVITDVSKSMDLIQYYNSSTARDQSGRATSFQATASILGDLMPSFHRSAPQVALFSSRGPDVKDFSLQDADVLKPDILAPGSLIWAAWTPNGTDEVNYMGEGFAMISGTSMAAPHIAGIAALIKQKHRDWSPAAIKSALMTTAITVDRAGQPLQAQQYSGLETTVLAPATPFDCGSGAVHPRVALDPGLIFDTGYDDYIKFLCSVPGIDPHEVRDITTKICISSFSHPADLNTPSITISSLKGTQTVVRTVKNVAGAETYTLTSRMSPEIAMEVSPPAMTLESGANKTFSVTMTVRSVTGKYGFGEILMKGDRGHKVRIPVAVMGVGH
ncbi:subtilisin-like protease SBT2.5 [Nymphaea colorata]|nr:subtilisin-like protease SBT2.5 [Nymphaea colorata]XP_031501311.1 subtilisin-like protease SBT2.5 [Nymphaea colorata]